MTRGVGHNVPRGFKKCSKCPRLTACAAGVCGKCLAQCVDNNYGTINSRPLTTPPSKEYTK